MGELSEPMGPSGKRPRERVAAGIVIREMEIEDLSLVFSLGERLFTAEKWPNLYRTWDEYELVDFFLSDGEFCLVAEIHDLIVGFSLGTLLEKRRSAWAYGYLVWIGVSSDLKRAGLGTRLVNRMTELFIEAGARMLLVDTEVENQGAIRFFKKQGFGHEIAHLYLSRNLSTHPEYIKKRAARIHEKGRRVTKTGPTGASFPAHAGGIRATPNRSGTSREAARRPAIERNDVLAVKIIINAPRASAAFCLARTTIPNSGTPQHGPATSIECVKPGSTVCAWENLHGA